MKMRDTDGSLNRPMRQVDLTMSRGFWPACSKTKPPDLSLTAPGLRNLPGAVFDRDQVRQCSLNPTLPCYLLEVAPNG